MGYFLWLTQFLSLLLFRFPFPATCSSSSFSSNFSSSTQLCHHDESLALLQFKKSFSIDSSASEGICEYAPYPKTGTWKEGTNCCLWDGVTCHMETGHVIGLHLACSMLYGTLHSNSSLFFLRHLQQLDLSDNDFSHSHIPSQIGQLLDLTHLDLSNSAFAGKFPDAVFQRPNLQLLYLGGNEDLTGSFTSSNGSALQYMDLSGTKISIHLDDDLFSGLKSLNELLLSGCNIAPSNLALLGNLTQLTDLDLSNNNFNGEIPSSLGKLTKLTSLRLSQNNFGGEVLPLLSNLTKLIELNLRDNHFSGKIPSSFGNLTQLERLELWDNNFEGEIPSSFGNLNQLDYIDLHMNNFSGRIPENFSNLTNLRFLDLGFNNFTGQIPSSIENLRLLNLVRLAVNRFSGQIPVYFIKLTQLRYLSLSVNRLVGRIPSQIVLSSLIHLDLSYNLLDGTIPSSLFSLPSLQALFLNSNQLIGGMVQFKYTSLKYLDLSNNSLHGQIPSSVFELVNLTALFLSSNNKMTGEVPYSVCKMKSLKILDLSNNSLSGFLPECLGNFSKHLQGLHLGGNNFQGTIPATFSEGNSLRYLNLNGNDLKGTIPPSIKNCRNLEFLDLGNNKIEDTFPYFLDTLPELRVIVLRSNKLHGTIKISPIRNFSFPKLQILDLSSNSLSGNLPTEYFSNFKTMMNASEDSGYMGTKLEGIMEIDIFIGDCPQSDCPPNMFLPFYRDYDYAVRLTWKRFEIDIVKIFDMLAEIDLSSNKFTGNIPESIGKLKSLKALNLSHNRLTGYIQPLLGYLTNLESLDLSSNLLTGRIPRQLADLTSLAVLNLSYNRLEGPIPQGKQFNTFDSGSYEGNLGLCDFPLPKKCKYGEGQQPAPSNVQEDNSQHENGFGWKVVLMGYGCGLIFGFIMGHVMFRARKPVWLMRVVEDNWLQKVKKIKNSQRRVGRRN